jgi:putative ABC transport system permease protein
MGDPLDLIPTVRKAVASVDPEIPVVEAKSFEDLIAQKFVTRRLSSLLVSICSGVAVLLAAIGLYGVLEYSVSQRTRDIGVRIALGAEPPNILKLVILYGLRLVVIGVIIGLISGLVLAHFIEGVLYGISSTDPITFASAVFILGLATVTASLLPALRAIRVNPITALRE